jgi:hypothetical protein
VRGLKITNNAAQLQNGQVKIWSKHLVCSNEGRITGEV